ncbi:aspartate aminotransferase family protein [Haloarcula sp. CBA1130]|uniref:pyridoxal phosphate-dependent decarboxylase family protein n=1 Tax=unclassified Haloarcula TaxID=2624677 RepID=UPI0012455D1F|nr:MULTISPECIES: pyridoxal-dependent decarboxylase [unclassified Haloarcula]KAA9396496.1 aspartate aminotransferase family protein [Haloarcula sp. CBA1130]KAA9397647.1 aspartate aminotransferase family protein [Haloarcula sp. CBA1129]
MNRSNSPETGFIDPSGANDEAVRDLAENVLDQLLDQLGTAEDRSPLPNESTIPSVTLPESPRSEGDLLGDLETIVEGSMNPAHPGYIGHMDTIPTTMSVLGDLVASAVNNNLLSVEMSPVFSELEVQLIETIASEFGLGPNPGGVLTSGGSLANLHALAVARNHTFDVHEDGLTGLDSEPVLFTSGVSHTSLQKAAMLLGLGTESVVTVETDADSRMKPSALTEAVEQTKRDGRTPFCVVATAGTTTTGNIDPLPALRDIAEQHDLWLHVDAAYGGALVFSEAERGRLDGIEAADSVTFNPQKWCYVAKTCAMALFGNVDVLQMDFRVGAPYMGDDDAIPNLGELSVQGTRRADVLKLWLTFQHLGRDGLEQLIDESYRLTAVLRSRVAEHDALELASDPEMNLVCFRAAPDWCPPEERDALNERLQRTLLAEHDVFVSLPTYRDNRWLRVVLLNPFTDEKTLDRLLDGIEAVLDAQQT